LSYPAYIHIKRAHMYTWHCPLVWLENIARLRVGYKWSGEVFLDIEGTVWGWLCYQHYPLLLVSL
jgi:hypothetical protein